jgi:hypothetical protein
LSSLLCLISLSLNSKNSQILLHIVKPHNWRSSSLYLGECNSPVTWNISSSAVRSASPSTRSCSQRTHTRYILCPQWFEHDSNVSRLVNLKTGVSML